MLLTKIVSKDLSDWRAALARFLDADCFSTSLIIPLFQRQRNVLNFTYWHALILTHRPFLLNNFTRLSQQSRSVGNDDPQTKDSVWQCLTAAMETARTIDDMTKNRLILGSFWVSVKQAIDVEEKLTSYRSQLTLASPRPSSFTSM